MVNNFLGEIQLFGFNFAPIYWAYCAGQTMSVSQNSALYSLLGTAYGGNGSTTFLLPNLQGAVPQSQGVGTGVNNPVIGLATGTSGVTLSTQELPMHNHTFDIFGGSTGATAAPANGSALKTVSGAYTAATPPPNTTMAPQMIGLTGNNAQHNNMQPYLAINFCICLQGVFPQRQ